VQPDCAEEHITLYVGDMREVHAGMVVVVPTLRHFDRTGVQIG
jgi:hypothetical protein